MAPASFRLLASSWYGKLSMRSRNVEGDLGAALEKTRIVSRIVAVSKGA